MNLNLLIDDLQEYCFIDNDSIKESKDLINDYQIEFLNGFIGIILNKYIKISKYEVYLNIKTKNKIASPLLYKVFENEEEAQKYFNSLKKIIEEKTENEIINCCKIKA